MTTTSITVPSKQALTPSLLQGIKILPVRPDKQPILKEGVSELFQLYFFELLELGCDLGFQGFQSEWTDLPGKYDFEIGGGLFVALDTTIGSWNNANTVDDCLNPSYEGQGSITNVSQVVGCVAIRPSSSEKCGELKRMYIRKSHRRFGIGQLLSRAVVDYAFDVGCYEEVRLDSLERLTGALKLYEGLGFQRMNEKYCDCPEYDHVCLNLKKDAWRSLQMSR